MNHKTFSSPHIGAILIVITVLLGWLPQLIGLNLCWSAVMLCAAGALYWNEKYNPHPNERLTLAVTVLTIAVALRVLRLGWTTPTLWLLAAGVLGWHVWRGRRLPRTITTLALLICLVSLFLTWRQIPSSFGLTTTGGWTYMPGPYGQMGSMVYGPAAGLTLGSYRPELNIEGRTSKGSILVFSLLVLSLLNAEQIERDRRFKAVIVGGLTLFALIHFSSHVGSLIYWVGLIALVVTLWRGESTSEVQNES